MLKKLTSLLLALSMLFSLSAVAFAEGEDTDVKGYVVLGEDLTADQQTTVLSLLGVEDLNDYSVSYTTHEEEVDCFGGYLSANVLGSRALSSILLIPGEEDSGIQVELKNINFCTEEMFQSALIDAGVEDVKLIVAGPIQLSGTCALTSAMKAYSLMTGEELDEDAMDAAANEIATTVTVAEDLGADEDSADDAAKLIAALKQQVLKLDLSEESIRETLDDLCETMDITLSDELKEEIVGLMLKLKDVDIDVEKLQEQASALYDEIAERFDLKLDKESVFDAIGKFLNNLAKSIMEFFSGLTKKE